MVVSQIHFVLNIQSRIHIRASILNKVEHTQVLLRLTHRPNHGSIVINFVTAQRDQARLGIHM